MYPLPLQREDFTNQNNGEQQTIPFWFVCIYIQQPLKKASAPHAMEQLDLKTEGEKKSVFKRFAEGAGAVQLQGPYHPPPQPQRGTTAQSTASLICCCRCGGKEGLVVSVWALMPHGSFWTQGFCASSSLFLCGDDISPHRDVVEINYLTTESRESLSNEHGEQAWEEMSNPASRAQPGPRTVNKAWRHMNNEVK